MKKKLRKWITIFYTILHEKNYVTKSGFKINYMYKKNGGNSIIICFSGFPGNNRKSKFNYIGILKKDKRDVLWINDSFGFNKTGSYYLIENGRFMIEDINFFINSFVKNYENIIFVGSSKGGYAALYYGILNNANYIIIGAPQFYVYNYLQTQDKRIINSMIVDNDDNAKIFLNNALKDIIEKEEYKGKIFLHYSVNDHTYKDHILPLLNIMKKRNYCIETDINTYLNHSEVGKYYPIYLKKILNDMV